MLSLLRLIFTEGDVYYDGLPVKSLNLEALRTNVTIIPQVVRLLYCPPYLGADFACSQSF